MEYKGEGLENILTHIEEMKDKERQQIIDAWEVGEGSCKFDGDNYFNETYGGQ